MAGEYNVSYEKTGLATITAKAFRGTAYTQIGATVTLTEVVPYIYAGDATVALVAGDKIVYYDDGVPIGSEVFKPFVILAAEGLDSISMTEPAGVPTTFREQLLLLVMRFVNKVVKDKVTKKIKVYNNAESAVVVEQGYSESNSADEISGVA